MTIPSTGNFILDVSLAFLTFLGGVVILMKMESKWGYLAMAFGLYWAYSIVAPFYR